MMGYVVGVVYGCSRVGVLCECVGYCVNGGM